MEKYERKATVAFDPGRRPRGGIEVSVKFPPAVFRKILQVKAMSSAQTIKDVIRAALDKHVETLRLLQEGYRIFAAPADFTDENTVAITPEWESLDEIEVDSQDVITEVQLGFEAQDLKLLSEIQEAMGLGHREISTPVIQSVLATFWMLDKQQNGYPSIHAVKDAPPRCAELKFDRDSLMIVGG
jgi:hypothetical protein